MRSDRRRGLVALVAIALPACATGAEGATPPPSPATTTVASAIATTIPAPEPVITDDVAVRSNPVSAALDAGQEPSTAPAPAPPLGDVIVVGDSLSAGLAAPLRAALDDGSRSFDWRWWVGFAVPNPSRVWETVLHDDRPDVVVLFFAAWESEVLRDGRALDPTDPNWEDRYRDDFVAPWVELVRSAETEIVWVGMTPSRDPLVSAHHAALNRVWQDVAAAMPEVRWIDGASIVGGPQGEFVAVDESVDPPARVVAFDGMHLCPSATARIAAEVLRSIGERRMVEPVPDWATAGWEAYPGAFGEGGCDVPVERSESPSAPTKSRGDDV